MRKAKEKLEREKMRRAQTRRRTDERIEGALAEQMAVPCAGQATVAGGVIGANSAAVPQQSRAARVLRNIGTTMGMFIGWFLLIGTIAFLIVSGFINVASHSAKAQLAELVSEDAVSKVTIGDTELYAMDDDKTSLLATGGAMGPADDGDAVGASADGAGGEADEAGEAGYVPPLPVDFADGIEEWDDDDMRYLFTSVPPQVYDILAPRGWKIHVVNDVRDSGIPVFDPDLTSIDGLTCGFTKEIWVVPAAGSNLFSHEVGHAIDWELGFCSLTPEFIGIAFKCEDVMKEKEELIRELGPTFIGSITVPSSISEICTRSKINEKWAMAFALYCTAPEWLLRDYPDCYLHFAKLFGVRGIAGMSGESGDADVIGELEEMIDAAIAEASVAPKAEYARAMERPWGEYSDDELCEDVDANTIHGILTRMFGLYDAVEDVSDAASDVAEGVNDDDDALVCAGTYAYGGK